LSQPLRDRFGIPLRLEFYTPEELVKVVVSTGRKLGAHLTEDGALEVATRSRGTPRVAGRLLRRVRDFATADNVERIDKKAAAKALARLEVDPSGLDQLDRRYLAAMIENY